MARLLFLICRESDTIYHTAKNVSTENLHHPAVMGSPGSMAYPLPFQLLYRDLRIIRNVITIYYYVLYSS